jgi:hypothetical protein
LPMPRTNEPNAPVSFRPGDDIKQRVERFAVPRPIPMHTAMRILLKAGLERVERGEIIDLRDPMRAAPA